MAVWVTILRFMGDLPEPNFTSGVGDIKVLPLFRILLLCVCVHVRMQHGSYDRQTDIQRNKQTDRQKKTEQANQHTKHTSTDVYFAIYRIVHNLHGG